MEKKQQTTNIPVCPKCGKSYGINVRKDGTIRCRLCGYEGEKK
jgi:DNA-directed RNA polymerase subunit RPC12/RpoP